MLRDVRAQEPVVVGPYEVRRRLGAGGMGVVYLGSDGHRPVAIKIVDSRLADDAEFRARFRREITLARRVGGLCTAKVLAADPDANPPYLVTEYIPGPTLAEFVQAGGRMAGQPLTALAVGLAEALVAIHGCGVIHRDLKPGNVLLGPHGPRVVDLRLPAPAPPPGPLPTPSARDAFPLFADRAIGTRDAGGAGRASGWRIWLAGGLALAVIALVLLMVTGTLRVRLGDGAEDSPVTSISTAGTAHATSTEQPAVPENCASQVPDEVIGRWKGDITQPTPFSPITYSGTLVLERGCAGAKVGTFDILEWGCAGTIELIEPAEMVRLASRTTQTQSPCDPQAEIRVQARPNGSLYIELYHTLPATAEPAATGLLSRVS